jgi:telomere length regulation protein
VLEQSLQSFGDKLYVKHSPILQQEGNLCFLLQVTKLMGIVNAQILLLTAGYVHRTLPSFVSTMSKSGVYLNAISNRLSASSTRSRFLGMAVGVAISRLVDPPEKAMKFDLDGISGGDSEWYLSLTKVEDHIGSMKDVKLPQSKRHESEKGTQSKLNVKPSKKTAPLKSEGRTSKIISIEEISDDENESDDMMGYEKPDSDAEDSEDDPTLINRKKPSAPV